MMELPAYCQIVPMPKPGYEWYRMVSVRNRCLIPDQNTTPYVTDEHLVQNFWDWVKKNPAVVVQVCQDARLRETF